jgi:hypothetical protein
LRWHASEPTFHDKILMRLPSDEVKLDIEIWNIEQDAARTKKTG